MIHDSQQGFELSRLNSLFSWPFSQVKRSKSMGLLMDLWHLNNMKVMTLNYVDWVPFPCIDSFHNCS